MSSSSAPSTPRSRARWTAPPGNCTPSPSPPARRADRLALAFAALAALLIVAVALLFGRGAHVPAADIAGGCEQGPLDAYLARIETLASEGHDSFFVSATAPDDVRFQQISAGRDRDGALRYRMSLPLVPWSETLIPVIEREAEKRDHGPQRDGGQPVEFLDIDFDTTGEHAIFARWIAGEAFGVPGEAIWRIEWG